MSVLQSSFHRLGVVSPGVYDKKAWTNCSLRHGASHTDQLVRLRFHALDDKPTRCQRDIPRLPENPRIPLAKGHEADSTEWMIRRRFLDSESLKDLTELARDGSAAHRLARRANALVLLDDGMSCEAIAKVLLLDDDTVRTSAGCTRKTGPRAWRASATRAARAA